jgi:hypothetical protein
MAKMTREERLISMRGVDLIEVGEKLGLKITKNDLKKGKLAVVHMILKAEDEAWEDQPAPKAEPISIIKPDDLVPMPGSELDPEEGREKARKQSIKKTEDLPKPKRGQLIEYNGKAQNICAWAKELGKNANTLYGRIYKLGWSVEDAFTK